jgi:hypothetical protein
MLSPHLVVGHDGSAGSYGYRLSLGMKSSCSEKDTPKPATPIAMLIMSSPLACVWNPTDATALCMRSYIQRTQERTPFLELEQLSPRKSNIVNSTITALPDSQNPLRTLRTLHRIRTIQSLAHPPILCAAEIDRFPFHADQAELPSRIETSIGTAGRRGHSSDLG